jgi:hypothetical protein
VDEKLSSMNPTCPRGLRAGLLAMLAAAPLAGAGCESSQPGHAQPAASVPSVTTPAGQPRPDPNLGRPPNTRLLDGRVSVSGRLMVVTPMDGAPPRTLAPGPSIPLGQLQAYAATKEIVRVYYRDGLAVKTAAIERIASGFPSVKGVITGVGPDTFTVREAGGTIVLLSVQPQDAGTLNQGALLAHVRAHDPVQAFYRENGATEDDAFFLKDL